MKTTEKLINFVNQRPGLDFANYGDMKYYRQDYNGIRKDRLSFFEFLNVCYRRIENLDDKLTKHLENNSGRLTIKDGEIQYITGQYFPVEYRDAACRVLTSLLWEDFRTEKDQDGEFIYKDGIEIRKAIRRTLRSRNSKEYFL